MMKFINYIAFIIFILYSFQTHAQRGKDGNKVVSANTVINEYTYLTSDAVADSSTINVNSNNLNSNNRFNGPLSAGDLIMIIQLQGATVKSSVKDNTWGEILNYNNAGLYEFAQVFGVQGSNGIILDCPLKNNYTATAHTQIVRVPRYMSLTVNDGVLSGDSWNGTVGGILAIEVLNSTIVNNGASMNMSGKGFRGGKAADKLNAYGVDDYYWATGEYGAEKGEGIAGYETDYDTNLGGRFCRGAPANGGGGGNVHDHGGGGGANAGTISLWTGKGNPDTSNTNWKLAWNLESPGFATSSSSGGGRGGYSFSNKDENALVLGPVNDAWGGDRRNNNGGLGGRPLDYSSGRIYMGGGGGAGEQSDGVGSSGANGGGIIFIQSYGPINGDGQIISNGADAGPTTGDGIDGAGGGGGGGTIIVQSTGNITGITLAANGGKGGSQIVSAYITQAEGPGGGGGGGYIAISNGSVTRNTNGGANGTTDSRQMTEFPPNGATKGGSGINNASIDAFYIIPQNDTVCYGQSATLDASCGGAPPAGISYVWYDALTGGNIIGTGNTFTTPPITQKTIFFVGTCPGTYRVPDTVFLSNVNANAGEDVAICNGDSIQLIASGGNIYSWTPTNGLSNPNIENPFAKPVSSTMYFVYASDGSGCSGVDSVFVTVHPTPMVDAGNDTSICEGTSIPLQVTGGVSYLWSPGITLSDSTISNPIATPLQSIKYTVYVEDGNACSASDDITVTVVSDLAVQIFPPNPDICMGGSIQLTASGGSSYSWSPAIGLSSIDNDTVIASPLTTTTYTVFVSNSAGCSGSIATTVTIGSNFDLFATPDSSLICKSDSATISVSGGGSIYSWFPSAGLSFTSGSNIKASPDNSTTYYVSSYILGENIIMNGNFESGNTGFSSDYTYIFPNAGEGEYYIGSDPPSFNGAFSDCADHTTGTGNMMIVNGAEQAGENGWCQTISVSPNTNYHFSTWAASLYSLSPAVLQFSINGQMLGNPFNLTSTTCSWNQFYEIWNSGTTTEATICIVNQNTQLNGNDFALDDISFSPMCTGIDSVVVSVTSILIPDISADTTICEGGTATLTATGGTHFIWSNDSTTSTINVSPTTTTNYTVTVSSGGCSGTASVQVNVVSLSVNISATNEYCDLSNGTASAMVSGCSGMYSFNWNTIPEQTTQVLTNIAANTYTVTVSCNGCSASANTTIINMPGATTTINNIVNASCGLLNGSAEVVTSGGTPPYTYTWSNMQSTPILMNVAGGKYMVTVTDNAGCIAIDSVQIDDMPGITLNISDTTTASCGIANGSAILEVSGGTPPYTYYWNSNPSQTNQNLESVFAGNYTVNVSDSVGCTSSLSVVISEKQGPSLSLSSQNELCNQQNGSVSAVASGGTGSYFYLWNTGDTTAIVSGLSEGIYTVKVTDQGCSVSAAIMVSETQGPTAKFIAKPAVTTLGSKIHFTDQSLGDIVNWEWNLGDGGANEFGQSIDYIYNNTGTFNITLTVTDKNGCTNQYIDTVLVKDYFTLYIPNAFTPTDDELNDLFMPQGINIDTDNYYFAVFDAWGYRIFETTKWGEGWNGTVENKGDPIFDAVEGVYVYIVKCQDFFGNKKTYIGRITLIP